MKASLIIRKGLVKVSSNNYHIFNAFNYLNFMLYFIYIANLSMKCKRKGLTKTTVREKNIHAFSWENDPLSV